MSQLKLTDCGLSDSHIKAICSVFESYPGIHRVVFYGSRAKGNYRPGSDIDLTMQGDQLNYTDLVVIDNELDDLLLPYTIDLSIYHQIESSNLIAHIERVGKEFYSKDSQ